MARALAIEPQVLLLDEPLSALDAKIRVALRREIRAIQRQLGITTVYVTHDQEEALSLSDRVVVMSEGRIEQIGVPAEIYNSPATPFVASFVGTLNLIAAHVIDAGMGRLSVEGQEVRTAKPVTEGHDGDTVTLALRPESLEFGDGGGANRLRGTIEDVGFLGSIVRTRIRVGEDAVDLARHVQRPGRQPARARLDRDRVVRARGLPRRRLWSGARGRRRRGGMTEPGPRRLSALLDGIDLVVFDKDGTLVDFHAMWGGWARDLGVRLDGATRRPVSGDVFAAIGYDPTSERVRAGAPLAVATMAEIQEVVAAVVRRWCPSVAAARRAVETAWFEPDPVATAVPLADLAGCSPRYAAMAGRSRSRRRTTAPRPRRRFAAWGSAATSRRSRAATTASASSPIRRCCSRSARRSGSRRNGQRWSATRPPTWRWAVRPAPGG